MAEEAKSNKRKNYDDDESETTAEETKLVLRKSIRSAKWRFDSLKMFYLDYIGDICELAPAKRILDLKEYLKKRLFISNEMDCP
jgi:hypothetical protein